ncbi:MAG: hypothetical protein HY000_02715 [Planctomycetes bacterium]|nr:hypothetical protein [Planctomycetota bacterium]
MNEDEVAELSRGAFLRASAAGVAGLRMASLAATAAAGNVEQFPTRRGYVVAVTHGHADATRVMLALFTATRLPAGDNHVWFAIDGGPLCKKGEADKVTSPLFTKQGNAAKLLAQIHEKGIALHI